MKNITITLDEEVARWARIKAAEAETSVSRLVGEMLRQSMLNEQAYRSAMHRFLAKEPKPISETGSAYPERDEVHERQDFC
jgi:plasmid stability protein